MKVGLCHMSGWFNSIPQFIIIYYLLFELVQIKLITASYEVYI